MSTNSRVIALYYATRDGQARRIAEHICGRLAENGPLAPPQDVAIAKPTPEDLTAASLIVLVAAVRYGKHLPEADRFLAAYDRWPRRRRWRWPRSISPPANRKRPRRRATHICARPSRATASRRRWRSPSPGGSTTSATAGAIARYPFHHVADRRADRPHTRIEYTSWDAVDEFADRIDYGAELIVDRSAHGLQAALAQLQRVRLDHEPHLIQRHQPIELTSLGLHHARVKICGPTQTT